MPHNYIFKDENGLVDIQTLSPSGNFYYRVQPPEALNPAAFGVRIAFYSISNNLIYHRDKAFAHELHSLDEMNVEADIDRQYDKTSGEGAGRGLKFVAWSAKGNMVYFLEYFASSSETHYESVILFLPDRICFRIDEEKDHFAMVNKWGIVSDGFDEDRVLSSLNISGVSPASLPVDPIINGLFSHKWYPEL